MLEAMERPGLRQCPRCSGPLFQVLDDERRCLYCGECVFMSPPPRERPKRMHVGPRRPGRPRKHA
jgi:hypothetical protein